MSKAHRITLAIVLMAICASSGMFAPALAGTGQTITLPTDNQTKIKNGIIAEIDTRWVEGMGYRPVTLTLSTRKSKRDRSLRVVLMPESRSSSSEPLKVEFNIDIPAGEKGAKKTVFLPQQTPWSVFRADFYLGKRKLKDLSIKYGVYQNNRTYNIDSPCMLLVDSDAPSIKTDRQPILKQLNRSKSRDLPPGEKFRFIATDHYRANHDVDAELDSVVDDTNDYETLTLMSTLGNLDVIPPTDLPTGYVGLAGVDLVVISFNDLQDLKGNHPKRFQAIDYYVRNGGNVVVFADQNTAQQLDDLLESPSDWKASATTLYRPNARLRYRDMSMDKPLNQIKRRQIPDDLPDFQIATHGLGRMVAMDLADPYQQNIQFWQWVQRSIGIERLTWTERHGISTVHNNDDYWDFMIPGYGASPVESFLGVITLFIIGIGPLNFWLLKKARRLYLLPLTVAAAALLTTVTMLIYALVSDGITTRVRLRSYTQLEQRADDSIASTHCRHSYLAAIVPSQGLVFPLESCVYPIAPQIDQWTERQEILNERTQKRTLTRGYIRPRSTTQFLTTSVKQLEAGIGIGAQQGIHSAVNNIGVRLSHAWVRDEAGELYYAANVGPNEPLSLQRADSKEARKAYLKMVTDNKPVPPEGLDKSSTGMFSTSRYYYSSAPPATTASALLTKSIASPGNGVTDFFTASTPKAYLLVTEEAPPFITLGTVGKQMAGFHVISGAW